MRTPSENMAGIAKAVNAIIPKMILLLLRQQIKNMQTRSLKGVDLDGNAFAPYNTWYAFNKQRAYGHMDWLRLSGDMMNSFAGRLKTTDKGDIVIGSHGISSSEFNNYKAQINNFGGLNEQGNKVPARSFFGYTLEETAEIQKQAQTYLTEAIYSAIR